MFSSAEGALEREPVFERMGPVWELGREKFRW